MGQLRRQYDKRIDFGFSIRSFGSFDGTLKQYNPASTAGSFSIRSFGSFDGTYCNLAVLDDKPVCFSIRSFGSFDGTVSEHGRGAVNLLFQYPLFRII